MGRSWDSDKGGRDQWIDWLSEIMREALRVIKPGGHALVWSLPRTSHWTAMALEEAGWEIRDSIAHLFGSGMPKSHNISKAVDKLYGAEREVIGQGPYASRKPRPYEGGNALHISQHDTRVGNPISKPATPEAEQWNGWGTGLKPAHETWWLARAPLSELSIAANVLIHGVGALNIDASRIGTVSDMNPRDFDDRHRTAPKFCGILNNGKTGEYCARTGTVPDGRWPANLLLSHTLFCTEEQCADGCPVLALDRQGGMRKSGGGVKTKIHRNDPQANVSFGAMHYTHKGTYTQYCEASEGGASRYFQQFYYCPKASQRERDAGCETLSEQPAFDKNTSQSIAHINHETGATTYTEYTPSLRKNHHPTVKPVKLIEYLVQLITPPNGIVLDIFAGSGSTGIAAIQSGFHYLLIEQEAEYVEIARARIAHAEQQIKKGVLR